MSDEFINSLLTGLAILELNFQETFKDNYYTVKLENAIITRIKPQSPHRYDPSKPVYKFMEDVSFAYEKIIWTHESEGIEHEDLWVTPET